jgi:acyl-CoA synthetase (AMP-forming)/AMP-acid ligase II
MPELPRTLPAALRAAAERHGDHAAYVEAGRSLSFAGLLDQVRATAAGYTTLGLEPGGRVVLWAPNSIDWAVAALAVSYAGGVLVPANSRYTGHEVAEIVDRTGAALVVVHDGFLGRTQIADLNAASDLSSVLEVVDLAHLAWVGQLGEDAGSDEIEARADAVAPDDVADILFTSGTTGRPKGAMSAHRQTVGVARAWGELGGVTPEDRYLVINPFFHSFGYKAGIVVGLTTGATLYPVATFDLDRTMQQIQDDRISVLPGAPTIYQSLLNAPRRER